MEHLFFDLDGTLLDSAEGIVGAFAAVMDHFSLPYRDKSEFRCVIGPPLYECFPRFGIPTGKEKEALAVFQEYYARRGVYENRLFDGVEDALRDLRASGVHLYVVTAKPHLFALQILTRLDILSLFDGIRGADMEEKNVEKAELLGQLLSEMGLVPSRQMAMVGDRSYDIVGGRACGIRTVGVLWGIGTKEELMGAFADVLLSSPQQLLSLKEL